MASIIPGYQYDIFISYRQKDNKHDGWVTEFVNNLKGELESTFKEEISVYFDINPHDGLLETHDVDASLKEKLKCLIFIPIISRTYCDPKSFAWEHEFKAFLEMATNDQFGLKVKLPDGNVASRVLPVQIHDLDPEDKICIENELGGHFRGIEFIYKESGVNRPLSSSEPHPDSNLNKTIYKNQINKVANASKEIIRGLKGNSPTFRKEETSLSKSNWISRKKAKLGAILLILLVTGAFIVLRKIPGKHSLQKNLIAVNFYERGKDEFSKYLITKNPELLNIAYTSYHKAIRSDSLFAEALVGLASVIYERLPETNIYNTEFLDSIMICCNKAIAINDHLSDAYSYLGLYYYEMTNLGKAEQQLKLALEHDPANYLAFYGLGLLYRKQDILNSVENFNKALSYAPENFKTKILVPLAGIYVEAGFDIKAEYLYKEIYQIENNYCMYMYRLAIKEFCLGNYYEDLQYSIKAYNADSTREYIVTWLAYTYFMLRNYDQSLKYYEKPLLNQSNDPLVFDLQRIAFCYFKSGLIVKGNSFINRAIEDLKNRCDLGRQSRSGEPCYDLACAYAVKGDVDRELLYLKAYINKNYITLNMLTLIKNDPLLENIRDNYEYLRIITSADQKYHEEHERVRKWLEENKML
jgi:tetratricopeptide (TPR) repeat protein